MQFPIARTVAVVDCVCIVRSTQKINKINRECPATTAIALPGASSSEGQKSPEFR
jgi:hypothetical protein